MLAKLARELPVGPFSYEPKWDGFRCLASVGGGSVALRSRHERPLERYFPEIVEALVRLGVEAAFDGELVIAGPAGPCFPALLARLHPAPSRVAQLRRETPASFVAFDLLASGGEDLTAQPFRARRARLESLLRAPPSALSLTPSTRDAALAVRWLEIPPGRGIDGVVAKHDGLTYQPGKRAMVKVKRLRTVDCVVAGYRTFGDAGAVASLLLGLHDGPVLRHVGVVSSLRDAHRLQFLEELRAWVSPLPGHPWEHGFNLGESAIVGRLGGSAGRWDPRSMALDWTPLRPELVCEVAYDQRDGFRFRNPARLVRWRPDREGVSCSVDQLDAPRPRPAAS
jgi:ATP-dependent DNA ligase